MPTTTTTVTHPDGTSVVTRTTAAAAPAPAAPSGGTKPHLIYFEAVGGRGEPICLVLRLANVDYEYETFGLADFGNPDSAYLTRKVAGEFGSFAVSGGGFLPVYKENGKTYFETNAILRMLGARHGFYSTDPDTMWEIDICMEKTEQVFSHGGSAEHSHYCMANIGKAAEPPQGDGPTEEQTAACFAMYEEFCNWGEAQLTKHGKEFLAGTDGPTVADFRYIVQFSDSVYNYDPSSVLGAEMQRRVKAMVDTKPALKKWILETMAEVLKGAHTPNLMW